MQRLSDAEVSGKEKKKPLASKYGKDLILVDLPGWFTKERRRDFMQRYKEDYYGFILAALFVCLLVIMAWGVIQL